MVFLQNAKIYMTAEDETEETLALVAMLEGITVSQLYESIDLHRSAGCGFARAAKIFATHYLRTFLDNGTAEPHSVYTNAVALQRAMMAVANDRPTAALEDE
jgi:hypothetical protein